ncbi:hypothetical protein TNCV_1465851 [Trichonephila clavipes]|nr:hypothetical protein TNCV_1465851 [Trichonephila clavipes]
MLHNSLGNLVIKVTDSWPACHEFQPRTTENPSRREAIHVKFVETQTFSHWCGVEIRKGMCHLRFCPRHLTTAKNHESIGLQTGGPGFDARCHQIPSEYTNETNEYVLDKSVSPKVLWAVTEETKGAGDWRIYFPSPLVPFLDCGGGERWCRHLSCRRPTYLRLRQISFLSYEKN